MAPGAVGIVLPSRLLYLLAHCIRLTAFMCWLIFWTDKCIMALSVKPPIFYFLFSIFKYLIVFTAFIFCFIFG